ncbi:MAG: 5'-methylthioadenosine/S-adenosylhomocysteine nucleosidase [Anaerolineae bacterium]|nr:5'-methylthioadenosine/S-adenosylhomocysteine nucleosidase [Anaerolineae bacterium]
MGDCCTVGIVVVESEAWPLRRKAQPVATWEHPCAGFWRARWADMDLYVARTSPGKVNAALAAQALLQRTRTDLLMSVGTAGALGDLQVGDVVIATEVLWHDTGLYLGNRFVHFGGFVYVPGRGRAVRESYRLPAPWEEASRAWAERRSTAEQARIRVRWGTVVTGDQVVLSTQRKQYLRKRFGALAVEMESAAVAQVAESWGVPWLVVRAASDQANSEAGFDFTPLAQWSTAGNDLLARSRAAVRLARVWAADPAWRRKLRQVRNGLKVASANAAEVALALAASPEVRGLLAEMGGKSAHRRGRPAGA